MTRNRKAIALRLLTAVMAVCFAAALFALPASANSGFKQEVKNGVCVVANVVCYNNGKEQLYSNGTGFFIGESGKDPQYLITNHHVVEDFLRYGQGEEQANGRLILRVYYDQNDHTDAYVVDYNERSDIAILKLEDPTDKKSPLPLKAPDDSMQGANIYCVGFPAYSDNDTMTAISKWGENDVTVTTGVVSRILTLTNPDGVKAIQTDAVINHGNSGGPMVDFDGAVLGINSWGVSDDGTNVNYAVSISEAIALLDKNHIPYHTAESLKVPDDDKSSASEPDSDSDSGSNSETDKDSEKDKQKYEDDDDDDDESSSMGLIIAIVAGAVVVIGIIAFAATRGKNKGTGGSLPAQSANLPEQSGTKKAVIRSMSPQHEGKAFPVGKTPVTIGRGACDIAYLDGTPGVSGKHCMVSFDPDTGIFTLTDLGSTYGTFLGSGTKLAANMPVNLRQGDCFYVGDRANIIKLEVE